MIDREDMLELLNGVKECALKNDALLYSFYEQISEVLDTPSCLENGYAVFLFHGRYDIPSRECGSIRLCVYRLPDLVVYSTDYH